MKERLKSEEVHLELTFPYFIDKKAPVPDNRASWTSMLPLKYRATEGRFYSRDEGAGDQPMPCSKEISRYGAHNQRCEMTVRVRLAEGQHLWIEELFEWSSVAPRHRSSRFSNDLTKNGYRTGV